MSDRMSDEKEGYWWCAGCKAAVLPQTITNSEHHDLCGHEAEWIDTELCLVEQLTVDLQKARARILELEARVVELELRVKELEANENEDYCGLMSCLKIRNENLNAAEAKLERVEGLLKIASCPQNCINGAVPDGYDGCHQCQFCDERGQALKDSSDG